MGEKTLPWFDQLTDSVRALGEAANEYRLAHLAAKVSYAGVDLMRRTLQEGKVGVSRVGGGTVYPDTRGPHNIAVITLSSMYSHQMHRIENCYEDAALLYASGAAWAIQAVQAGQTPERVEFEVGPDGKLIPRSMAITGLEPCTVAKPLAAASERLSRCLDAAVYGEGIDAQGYVADHEAAAMHDALDVARGIPDAAMAYGLLAEQGLSYVLLEPKRQHERQLAAERRAAAATDGAT